MSDLNSSKLKIGIVLSSIPGYSETFFRNKIKGLQNKGINVILFVDLPFDDSSNLSCKVLRIHNFDRTLFSKISSSVFAILKLLFINPRRSLRHFNLDKKDGLSFKNSIRNLLLNQFLLNQDLDWLHFGYGMLASNRENVAEAIGAKMAVSFRGFDLYLSPLKHGNCYETLFTKQVKYHVLSQKMKERLIAHKISENSIKVITPAIDINFFNDHRRSQNKNNPIKLVCVSRLHWVKGLDYMLDALALLKLQGLDFKMTIIGDGEARERLIFAAHKLEIIDNLIFTGKLSQDEVITYLSMADIYIQYSIQEGFGNAVLEAQAMGLFCIVSDADGLKENVVHEKSGFIVPKRNPKLLAKCIKDVIELDSEKKQEMTRFAIERVKNEFNLTQQNNAFENFYNF